MEYSPARTVYTGARQLSNRLPRLTRKLSPKANTDDGPTMLWTTPLLAPLLAAHPLRASGSQAEGAIAGKGSVQRIKIHGKALEGNLEGESPDRDVTIYLPPRYATDRNRRYPVIYLLHGYSGTDENWTKGIPVPEIADRVVGSGTAGEMIDQYIPHVKKLHAIGFDIGNQTRPWRHAPSRSSTRF